MHAYSAFCHCTYELYCTGKLNNAHFFGVIEAANMIGGYTEHVRELDQNL